MSDGSRPTPPEPAKRPSALSRLLRGVVSGGLLIWLVSRVDWPQVAGALVGVPWWMLVLAWCVAVAGILLWPLRLQLLLRVQHIHERYPALTRITFVGLFFGNVLPSSMGSDMVKLSLLIGRHPGRHARITFSVIADRLANILATLLVLGAVSAFPGLLSPGLALAGGALRAGCAVLLVGVGIFLLALPRLRSTLHAHRTGPGERGRLAGRLRDLLHGLVHALADWAAAPGTFLAALAISALSILLFFAASRILAAGLGINVGAADWIALQGLVAMVGILPVSLNGIGLQETGVVLLLGRLGVGAEHSMAFALLNRLLIVCASLPGIVGALGRARR